MPQSWMAPLWNWWCTTGTNSTTIRGIFTLEIRRAIVSHLQLEGERTVQHLNFGSSEWGTAILVLPTPWSYTFGMQYLQALREFTKSLTSTAYSQSQYWLQSLSTAARGLPLSCFTAAEEEWTLPEISDNYGWQRIWEREL